MNTSQVPVDQEWLVDDASNEAAADLKTLKPWRILIVDDEVDIHSVTRLALRQVLFKGRRLEFLSAYNGMQGYDILKQESDIALVLLDVVMESQDAGLRLAQRIRSELGNHTVRIVLRTGQPGVAPEEQVIVDFDINDYKAKTELTKQKLFTTAISSLRAYEGLVALERNSQGLHKILIGAGDLYQQTSLKEFASGVLEQIGAILGIGADGVLCVSRPDAGDVASRPSIIAATGNCAGLAEEAQLPAEHAWAEVVASALRQQCSVYRESINALFVPTKAGHDFVIVFAPPWPLEGWQRDLLGVFCDRISAAFDNLHMVTQLQKAQEATVIALADLAESRDPDTGGHVQRVCKLTDAIAMQMHLSGKLPHDLPPQFLAQVGLASMLHDVGKVATPDAVLLKPGRHTPEERVIMEQHVVVGESVLQRAADMVGGDNHLAIGAQIAGAHHEHFDGNGYPRRLQGLAIPIGARIVAVVDVFDALLHARPYKAPWPLADVLVYLRERSGTQFDPDVVTALNEFIAAGVPDWLIGEGH